MEKGLTSGKDTVPFTPSPYTLALLTDSLYDDEARARILPGLKALVGKYRLPERTATVELLSERDAILITYGDQVSQKGEPPLNTLAEFCRRWVSGVIPGLHILPFYPSSSDDGFSVIDYRAVDPHLGSWDDVARIGRSFRLMFDAVVNHVSAESAWFRGFLQDEPRYRDYFVVVEGDPDLSLVVRPRALPLLTPFETPSGMKHVWTTFSADQVDLNYRSPDVLLELIDTLLFYVSRGAEFIRLDAIAYLWKEAGTTCIHHPQTHRLIQLMRAILDQVAPHVMLITETNVPHEENISYFGDGENEAQMVYNFALPPLVLYTLLTGDARYLSEWAQELILPSKRVTFFNFLASHDGIGVNPARGILPEAELEMLVQKTLEHGGFISFKNNTDGSKSPYELNISYFDALNNPGEDLPLKGQVDRFVAAQAIMLTLVGVPGIYFHSLFGSRGWVEGVQLTGLNRTINRQKLVREVLERELSDPGSQRLMVYERYRKLLHVRAGSPAFHPFGDQRVLDCGESVFALVRYSPDGRHEVLCLQNVSGQIRPAEMGQWVYNQGEGRRRKLKDLISGSLYPFHPKESIPLQPYQTLWLEGSD